MKRKKKAKKMAKGFKIFLCVFLSLCLLSVACLGAGFYYFKKNLHTCRPKPHYLSFNDKWEAECPHCKENNIKGIVRPVVAKTFATYIRNAWDFSYDQSLFVNDLLNESKNVGLIREVLETDKMDNE